jgi:hypothetical protein
MNILKKNITKTVFLLGFLVPILSFGQNNYCFTPPYTIHTALNSTLSNNAQNNSAFNTNLCLKIYMHVIRKSDGTDGQTLSSVNNAINILQSDFNPFNIKFVWDNTIDYINNTSYFNNPSGSIFTVNNHSDGIDIYLFDDSAPAGGLANGVGNSSELYVSGVFWGIPSVSLITSHVISHEMGHVLFLWHTHHGTYNEGGNGNPCAELVNGSNSTTCGDYVFDTPADPHLQFNVNHPSCTWASSGYDQNGDPYNPDEKNIMSYTNVSCMEYFTMQQGLRMRNAINSLTHLQNTIISQCCIGSSLDLFMRDRIDDNGSDAGYTWTWDFDDSPDIWVRNQDDGLINQSHQNPEYQAGSNVYVYVRVGNKSCVPSTVNEKLALYWTKASSNSSWPQNWDGTDPTIGNLIGIIDIPELQPGESTIRKLIWNILPNTGIGTTWNNCLLARIENSLVDPITIHPNDLAQDVYQNNNVSMRNCVITNYIFGIAPPIGVDRESFFYIGNPYDISNNYDIVFRNPENVSKPITVVAEVNVQLDQQGWNLLSNSLEGREDIRLKENYTFSIIGNNPVILSNINFPANTRLPIKIVCNFLIDEIDNLDTYKYHVIQKNSTQHNQLGDHWTGGIHFTINKGTRDLFNADAGADETIDKGESITLTAEQINEAAEYNWYDSEGNLIYTGASLSVSPEVTEKYKLEIVADADGFKDYDEVEVNVNRYTLENLSPNPASTNVTIGYDVEGANSAYLMIIGASNFIISNNYILNSTQTQINIDVSDYQMGIYTVALVVDGQIVDAKALMIQ